MTAYDAADHPVSFATQLAGSSSVDTVMYAYDAAGRRSSMAYGGVTDSYAYDDASRLSRLTSSQAGEFAYSYDAAGRRTGLARPNGVATSYAYNAADQVTSIVHARGGTTLDSSEYGYDAAGRRTLVSQHDGDHAYGYDAAGRVTSADNPGGLTDESFSYDDLGNRTGDGELFDAANRIQSRTGFTYRFDREGRMTERVAGNGDATRFSWDAQSRLRTITLPDGSVTQLRYDPMGRRIATTRNGQTRVQVYGLDPNAVAESTGSASVRNTFGIGYDTPLAMTSAGASTYFEQDALSSVTSLSGQSGAVVGRYGYDTYGQITGHTGTTSPYTYTGREYDAGSGLYDYRARWYEPGSGRFASEDTVASQNAFVYGAGTPTSLRDPSGETTLSEQEEVMTWGNQITPMQYGIFNSVFSGADQAARCGLDSGVLKAAGVGFATGFAGGFLANKLFRGFGRPAGRFEGQLGLFMANALTGGLSIFIGELVSGGTDAIDPGAILLGGLGSGIGGAAAGTSSIGGDIVLSASAAAFGTLAAELGEQIPDSGPARC